MTHIKTQYISGHGDLSQAEFDAHYRDRLFRAFMAYDSFVVGDFKGCDQMAQAYLTSLFIDPERVTVYHMLDNPRFNIGDFPTLGGFESDEDRDEAMTYASDDDIAWVRPGRETSGTAKNIERRKSIT